MDGRGDREPPWNAILGWVLAEVGAAARHYGLPDEQRDELRQRVCLRVLRSFERFDPETGEASLETWVRRHAGWGVADYWRERLGRERREKSSETLDRMEDARDGTPQRAASRRELAAALRQCLDKLTAAQRERFLLGERALGTTGTLASLAETLGIGRETLKASLKRARQLLRECLRRAGFEPARGVCFPPDDPGGAGSGAR